jgi:hypothetical protein
VRCQYCGKSSWWPFKRTTGGEFCSREHRESYHERLRKVAGRLSEYQDIPTEGVGAAVAAAVSVTQQELGSLPDSEIFPILECVPAATPAAAVLTNSETLDETETPVFAAELAELAAELAVESVGEPEPELAEMMREADATAARPREFVPLRIGDGAAGLGVWLPIPVLPAPGAAPTIQSVTAMVTPAFENYAQIKRWGLRIKFLKS